MSDEDLSESSDRPTGYSRRQALLGLGGGGAVLLGGGFVAGAVASGSTQAMADDGHAHGGLVSGASTSPVGDSAGPYGGEYSPPTWMTGTELDGVTWAPPARTGPAGRVLDVEIAVTEERIEVANGLVYEAWTYNGTVPGPTLRATEGESLRIRFRNLTGNNHNLHFHGRHSPTHDGWEPVPPGGETVYEIEAGPAGVHPYHCHTMPIDRHIAKGLYGTFIVDPPGGRPAAHEIMLLLGGWDPNRDGVNELYSWNGIAGFYEKFPIKIPHGEPVRTYLVNMVEFDPLASFHLHAETFSVWPAGMGEAPALVTDLLTLGQADRAMIEFTLSERGRYMFHPHQHSIASRGAMGWFAAV